MDTPISPAFSPSTALNSDRSGAIRVLLADDHAIVRAGIRLFLEQSPDLLVVAEAGDGQEACVLIAEHQPDVAVLDIQMPKMSGMDVARWIRRHNPCMGILILTAYDDDPYIQAVLLAGANGYVLKTSEPQEIIRGVREVHQGKLVLDAALASRFAGRAFRQSASTPPELLTERELEIVQLTAKGLTNKAIGIQLCISDRTVQNHLANIFLKLQAESRTEAVMRAVSMGLIPPNIVE